MSGYAQIVQSIPSPVDNTQQLSAINTTDGAVLQAVQEQLKFQQHLEELKRIDTVVTADFAATTTATKALSKNANRLKISVFNPLTVRLYIGYDSAISTSAFLSRLEPNTYHEIEGSEAQQEFYILSPDAPANSQVPVVEYLHNPANDLYSIDADLLLSLPSTVQTDVTQISQASPALTFTYAPFANQTVEGSTANVLTGHVYNTGQVTLPTDGAVAIPTAYTTYTSVGLSSGDKFVITLGSGANKVRTPVITLV